MPFMMYKVGSVSTLPSPTKKCCCLKRNKILHHAFTSLSMPCHLRQDNATKPAPMSCRAPYPQPSEGGDAEPLPLSMEQRDLQLILQLFAASFRSNPPQI
ncbi:plasma membrane calcium-transporting ATPase 2-like [Platysternon megacephalum]|uniref:Plasma membrane calcium-transporting ATPase 2-like n=1 Tax=Platysternon megacephalum TaxID=55544 RepID=A0A4D9EED4_9SAUR|nr:plasma membrane calcium-transporting ATPase 2-like [Platysternon megacephalum]